MKVSKPAFQQSLFDFKQTLSDNRMVGLWRMMKGYRCHYFGATIALGLAATLKTGTYLLINFLVDEVLSKQRFYLLPWIGLGFVVLALFEGVFTFTSGSLAAKTAEEIARRLRDYLFDHIQRLSFSYHDKTQTGELLQRATSDVDAIHRFFHQEAIGVGRIFLLFLVNFTAIAFLNWRLALLSIIAIPVITSMSYFFFIRIDKAYTAYQEQEARLSTSLQENLSGVRVVKAFTRQDYEIEKFNNENREKYRRGMHLLLNHTLYWPVSDIVAGAQMLFGFTLGALMAINGTITVGDYLAYAGMVIWIIWPMRNLGRLIVQASTALVSYKRVSEIIREDKEPIEAGTFIPEGNALGEIIFENVTFRYDEKSKALHNINFRVAPGKTVALMGAAGSGKSSLVNLLPRFYEYTSGKLTLDGVDLKDYPRKFLRSQIGIVEQEPFLFSRSIYDNIIYGFGKIVKEEEVYESARAAAIHDVISSFPQGYNTYVGERGVTLSGGQKQRIAIARTILKNPCILILDDATSSVDIETEASIRAALENLMKDRTTFIIAHRIQTVMHADLILVFDKGQIAQQGTHGRLIMEDGIYKQIFDMQARIEDRIQQELSRVEIKV